MRSTGLLDSARGLGRHDHLCWGFDDHAAFLTEAERFVSDGLHLGQRILYTAPASADELHHHLRGIADVDRLVADGTITLVPIDQTYAARLHGADQADAYAAATGDALAAGFSGLRVVADATVLVLDPNDRDAFVRYEHRIDRRMAEGLPFAALCGYDQSQLDPSAIDELACVHPLSHGANTTFRLHAADADGLALAGEIDAWQDESLRQALDRTLASEHTSPVAIDCSDLQFMHHRGLVAIDRAASDHRTELHLHHTATIVARLGGILDLRATRLTAT
jgi:anti-anti-sigma regulatory factor